MQFRTQIPIKKESNQIDYHSNILMIGSCFSDSIGKKLNYYKFTNFINPNGIVFNPISIENSVKEAVHKKEYTKDDLVFYDGLWHSFNHHSKFSGVTPELNVKNENIIAFYDALKTTTHLIITLGSAWVYRYLKTNTIVANCHKIPQNEFRKNLLSIAEIERSLQNTIDLIKSVNTDVSILFTVSPVRHLKDGFIKNQLSKSHLIAAIHNIKEKNVSYFPAYEIVMDELRDYRFYKEDMIHPNKIAINYIWERFCKTWMSDTTIQTMDEVTTIQKGLAHIPFHPKSEQHQEFLKNLETKIKELQLKFPEIHF